MRRFESWKFIEIIIELFLGIWHEFLYSLPFIAIGVLLEATIRTLKWHVKIHHALTRFGGFAIILATILGAVSPLCACATLPLVISLLLAGLPLAPAMVLLVTSPLMSPVGYTLLNWELGTVWVNMVLFSAVALGLFAGYLTHLLRPYGFNEEIIFRKKNSRKETFTTRIIRLRNCAVIVANCSPIGSTAASTINFTCFWSSSGKGR